MNSAKHNESDVIQNLRSRVHTSGKSKIKDDTCFVVVKFLCLFLNHVCVESCVIGFALKTISRTTTVTKILSEYTKYTKF